MTFDDDRNVADPALGHDPAQVLDGVLRSAGLDLARHDLRDALLEHANAIAMQVSHHVPLADDPRHRQAVIADHHGTDMVLLQDLQKLRDRRVRANGHHQVAFSPDHV